MIKIIGTSHISPESIKKIKKIIGEIKPKCVAVELDNNRLVALQRGEKISITSIKHIGFRNYFVAKILSLIQGHLGKKTGVIPGEEMLAAVKAAKESGASLALIDQDIRKTLDSLREIRFSEKVKLVFSLVRGKKAKFDLSKVPEDKLVEELIAYLKSISPTLYRVLIDERDSYMAIALYALEKKYVNIVAVVGIGHKPGIEEKLKQLYEMDGKSEKGHFVLKYPGMGSGPGVSS